MDEFDWNVFNETKLFEAMVDHKPIGINKYFQMALIWSKLQEDLEVSSDKIWTHLEKFYNLESLDEIDGIPFPNDEREFSLPEPEYGSLKIKKEEKIEDKTLKVNLVKKPESKEIQKVIKETTKKPEVVLTKKEIPRRDSKDGKEPKTPVSVGKKETKKEVDKIKPVKGKIPSKEEEKMKVKVQGEDVAKRVTKRPTRGSTKPDDTPTRKSQSPLTVTSSSNTKRRRI